MDGLFFEKNTTYGLSVVNNAKKGVLDTKLSSEKRNEA